MNKIKTMFKNDDGWTFMETIIVIAIILLLTATTGFVATSYLEKARKANAQTQIDTFCIALESYYIDMGNYPPEDIGLNALREKPSATNEQAWSGPYIYKKVPKDPWGNEYHYKMPGENGNPYEITSYGADGLEGGEGKNEDIKSW